MKESFNWFDRSNTGIAESLQVEAGVDDEAYSTLDGGHSSQPIQPKALTFVKQPSGADPDRRDAPQSGTGGDQEHDE